MKIVFFWKFGFKMRKRSLSVCATKLHFTIVKQFESQTTVILNLCFWKPSEACRCTALAGPLAGVVFLILREKLQNEGWERS